MKRAMRLRRQADFQRVRATKRSWGHPLLVLYAAPNSEDTTRIGVSVGKQVGGAVTRNRVRRRVREAVRRRDQDLKRGHDLLFIARASSLEADWASLRDATDELLRRARVTDKTGGDHA